MKDGFLPVSAVTPYVRVADARHNLQQHLIAIEEAHAQGAALVVFPELSLTGSTCGDLFFSATLHRQAEDALHALMKATAHLDILCVVGLPVRLLEKVINCAAVFLRGQLLGLVSASQGHCGVYSRTQFPFAAHRVSQEMHYAGQKTLISSDLLFRCETFRDFTLGVLFAPAGGYFHQRSNCIRYGATVIASLSSHRAQTGQAKIERQAIEILARQTSAAFVHCSAGLGESTTDFVFAGQNLIVERGRTLAESQLFSNGSLCAEIDLERLAQERIRMGLEVERAHEQKDDQIVIFHFLPRTIEGYTPQRAENPYPFVPTDREERQQRCEETLCIQSAGLAARLNHIGAKTATLGLSGGLDSTLALLVTVRAADRIEMPRNRILTISMPGFGTTGRTQSNAQRLASALGCAFKEISIVDAVNQHFADIGHDPDVRDITYENAQARERTQILMDVANSNEGIVIGTGDLSELALGWATYNGDHISMYGVNASIPKTLVCHLVAHVAQNTTDNALTAVLEDILATPVSPELLPPVNGEIAQKTEETVGPYALHDFTLYYFLRFGFSPAKIYRMALRAFADDYLPDEIARWMQVFFKRFFAQQFKRSCLPDGPAVGSISLSPRGGLNMPSDACVNLWLMELESAIGSS